MDRCLVWLPLAVALMQFPMQSEKRQESEGFAKQKIRKQKQRIHAHATMQRPSGWTLIDVTKTHSMCSV